MKKKIILLGLLFFLSFVSLNAQMSYYYRGEKINLTVDKDYVHIIADDELEKSSNSNQLFQRLNIEQVEDNQIQNISKLRLKSVSTIQEYEKIVESLKEDRQVKYVFPFFKRGEGVDPIGTSDIFYLRLKEVGDTTLLRKVAEQQNVQVIKKVPYMNTWYILSIQNSTFGNSVDATNYFYETGYFADIDPAFMFNFRPNCTNDTQFTALWGLKNTGQNSGTSGIDIKACDAWTITKGAGVDVAVFDQGIDPNHNDLSANFHSLSFDAQSGTSPSVFIGDYHGTHVAGTVAAIGNNNLQVVGVAPESKIMRVSHGFRVYSGVSAELASGISWAWRNGAEIITNSWGDWGGLYYNYLYSAVLENAIDSAMIYGRGMKGSVVVFAAGNTGLSNRVDYPGNFHDNILTIGSIDPNGYRSSFSNYGDKLDVVAPGENILSTVPYNNTDYDGGTSMAAPHVAGVAALVLSVNPNLTGQQVRDIIESTSQKVSPNNSYTYSTTSGKPNGTWNNQMGYGLVNAYAAVQAAACPPIVNLTNQIITTNTTVTSCGNINVQNVKVQNGAKLILDAAGEVNIISDFEVELGSEFEVK